MVSHQECSSQQLRVLHPLLPNYSTCSSAWARYPVLGSSLSYCTIPKSSRSHDPNNYRPISLLCILSKMLEKRIHSLLLSHLEDFHPLSDCQWGFRPCRSTATALLSTIHEWLQLLEAGKDICAVFLDYRKVFDSVPHAPLISKLVDIGLHSNLLGWVTDYLTN